MSENTRSGFVAIIGPANAGKSTLLNEILGEKVSIVSRKQQSTRNRIIGVKTYADTQIVFFDTPGFLNKGAKGEIAKVLTEALVTSVAEADLVLLVIDAAQAAGNPNIAKKMRELLQRRELKQPSIVVLNKIDLIDRKSLLPVIAALNHEFSGEEHPIDFVPISALEGDGIQEVLTLLRERLPEGPWYFPTEVVTDQSEQFLVTELIREALFNRLHQELPYSCAVRILTWEEDPKCLRIGAQILVERESQKGIVIGKRGVVLKAVGTEARLAIEKRLRTKVFLELFVRVEEDWTQSKKGLERAGYSQ